MGLFFISVETIWVFFKVLIFPFLGSIKISSLMRLIKVSGLRLLGIQEV